MLYYNIQMSEVVETPQNIQDEGDNESILSGTDAELTDEETEEKKQSTSPISDLEEKATDDEEDDEEDEDDEVDSEMLRKLEKDEYSNINYNDIVAMCDVVRDSEGMISDDFHKTVPWLTKYERARVLGIRAKQLNNGADAFVQVPSSMVSGYKIAIEELKAKKIPFIIRRPIPNGGTEYWRLEDLALLETY